MTPIDSKTLWPAWAEAIMFVLALVVLVGLMPLLGWLWGMWAAMVYCALVVLVLLVFIFTAVIEAGRNQDRRAGRLK